MNGNKIDEAIAAANNTFAKVGPDLLMRVGEILSPEEFALLQEGLALAMQRASFDFGVRFVATLSPEKQEKLRAIMFAVPGAEMAFARIKKAAR